MKSNQNLRAYWKRNLRYLALLLGIWFLVSYGFGIFFHPSLNSIQFGGFKLGFWFAQNGAIYGFVGIIFAYVFLMNRLDEEFDVHEGDRKTR